MFTGIITDTALVLRTTQKELGLLLTFKKPSSWTDLALGESVSTNGVCLTVAAIRANEYDCLLVPETLGKTVFGKSGIVKVNLERSLQMSDRLSGHFVQGHIDGIGKISNITKDADGYKFYIDYGSSNKKLVVARGSIAVNGVSLTIAEIKGGALSVALVPHTLEHTTFGNLKVGGLVNLEFDMIGKYILRSLEVK
jgi:riboflavin synthase